MVQWVRLHAPNAGGPGSIPHQGTRSHMHAATKSPHAATKTWRIYFKKYISISEEGESGLGDRG